MSAEIPRLSIEDGYLVARVDRCTCDPHYGAHEIHCGIVDHQRLDDLPGWPGAADRPSVTGAARAALAVALAKYEAKVERAQNSGQGTVIAILAGASLAHAVRDALAAGRAETTTATTEDAVNVDLDGIMERFALAQQDASHVIIYERMDASMSDVPELVAEVRRLTGLLATARTHPTRERIARAIGNARWGDEWLGVPDAQLLREADAVLALWTEVDQ